MNGQGANESHTLVGRSRAGNCDALPALDGWRTVLRPQQGSVPHVRLSDPQDRALRPVLLPGGSGGGVDRRADGRAMERSSVALLRPRTPWPAAARPLRG